MIIQLRKIYRTVQYDCQVKVIDGCGCDIMDDMLKKKIKDASDIVWKYCPNCGKPIEVEEIDTVNR